MDLHESGEMYLETILMLKNKNEYVRAIDIATAMNFSKPSVSRAMKLLKEAGLIVVDAKGYIDFTEEGKKIAEGVYRRHVAITKLFTQIGVHPIQAEEDACRVEHIISEETYQCILSFVEKQSS